MINLESPSPDRGSPVTIKFARRGRPPKPPGSRRVGGSFTLTLASLATLDRFVREFGTRSRVVNAALAEFDASRPASASERSASARLQSSAALESQAFGRGKKTTFALPDWTRAKLRRIARSYGGSINRALHAAVAAFDAPVPDAPQQRHTPKVRGFTRKTTGVEIGLEIASKIERYARGFGSQANVVVAAVAAYPETNTSSHDA